MAIEKPATRIRIILIEINLKTIEIRKVFLRAGASLWFSSGSAGGSMIWPIWVTSISLMFSISLLSIKVSIGETQLISKGKIGGFDDGRGTLVEKRTTCLIVSPQDSDEPGE